MKATKVTTACVQCVELWSGPDGLMTALFVAFDFVLRHHVRRHRLRGRKGAGSAEVKFGGLGPSAMAASFLCPCNSSDGAIAIEDQTKERSTIFLARGHHFTCSQLVKS
jgi:hypothetical protein